MSAFRLLKTSYPESGETPVIIEMSPELRGKCLNHG